MVVRLARRPRQKAQAQPEAGEAQATRVTSPYAKWGAISFRKCSTSRRTARFFACAVNLGGKNASVGQEILTRPDLGGSWHIYCCVDRV